MKIRIKGSMVKGRGFDGKMIYAGEDYFIMIQRDSLPAMSIRSLPANPRDMVMGVKELGSLSVRDGKIVKVDLKDRGIVKLGEMRI